jgi:hypothetical protein
MVKSYLVFAKGKRGEEKSSQSYSKIIQLFMAVCGNTKIETRVELQYLAYLGSPLEMWDLRTNFASMAQSFTTQAGWILEILVPCSTSRTTVSCPIRL